MATSVSKSGGVYVNLTSFHDLAINFKAVEPEMYKALALRLKMAGQLVADQAKSEASYSSEIAAAIGVRVSGLTVSIGVPVGDKHSPTYIRRLEEYAQGGWQHPVFGNRGNVVVQASYPYLGPALQKRGDAAALAIEAGVSEALDGALSI
jgi:hypothetical protein